MVMAKATWRSGPLERPAVAARFDALVAGVSGGPCGRLQRSRRPRGRVAVGTAVAVLRPLVRGMASSGESGHEREHDFLSDKKSPLTEMVGTLGAGVRRVLGTGAAICHGDVEGSVPWLWLRRRGRE